MFTTYTICPEELETVVSEAVAAAEMGGREICGLLVASGKTLTAVRLRNKRTRGGSWALYAEDARKCIVGMKRDGGEVIGTFHSHPLGFAEPGDSDIANAPDDSLMLVIDCFDRKWGLWHIRSGKAQRLRLVRRAPTQRSSVRGPVARAAELLRSA